MTRFRKSTNTRFLTFALRLRCLWEAIRSLCRSEVSTFWKSAFLLCALIGLSRQLLVWTMRLFACLTRSSSCCTAVRCVVRVCTTHSFCLESWDLQKQQRRNFLTMPNRRSRQEDRQLHYLCKGKPLVGARIGTSYLIESWLLKLGLAGAIVQHHDRTYASQKQTQ